MLTKAEQKAKEQFIQDAMDAAEKYKEDVLTGKQIANIWIQGAVKRSKRDESRDDIYHDSERVRRVFDFFFYIKIKNKYGKYGRFTLTPYQAWIISEIFGWFYCETGKRRYRYALLYTARKSGKTVFSVSIELYMLIGDFEEDPEAYLCARTREQAGQALKYTKRIVEKSRALRRRLKVQQFQIKYEKYGGLLKVLANRPENNDSLNPYVVIMDEMHAHETLDFYNVMKSGVLNRMNPLIIITSTAGFNMDYPFFKMVELGKRVCINEVEDDITFYALYTLDDDDELEDFSKWEKSNPNINQTIQLDDLVNEYKKAKLIPSELHNFKTKNLNIYLNNMESWIPDEDYATGFYDIKPPEKIKPKLYFALDMSSTRDLASLTGVWTDPETGKLATLCEFYFPNNPDKRIRNGGIDLRDWIDKGWIFELDEKSISDEFILDRISKLRQNFELELFFYDKWNLNHIASRLKNDFYVDCREFIQAATWFNFPLKYLEKMIYDEKIAFTKSPVMRWQFHNIKLYFDGNGNIKIAKHKSLDSVDGPVSLAMAIGAWLQGNESVVSEVFDSIINQNKKKVS